MFKSDGLDTVEFMISTNVGEDEKKLTKIASGGEMSRFMLAIKNVLADVDKIPVLIFDEIDTGISGVAAKVTGEKIKKISKHHQVLCVTHLASIAAKGDYNYFISKKVENGKTRTQVELLDEEKTLREIARISSGNITEISIKLAKELRNSRVREIA
jgi:DNA repair protein RecN (Recombination protein N)